VCESRNTKREMFLTTLYDDSDCGGNEDENYYNNDVIGDLFIDFLFRMKTFRFVFLY